MIKAILGFFLIGLGILFRRSKKNYLVNIHYVIIFLGIFFLMVSLGQVFKN